MQKKVCIWKIVTGTFLMPTGYNAPLRARSKFSRVTNISQCMKNLHLSKDMLKKFEVLGERYGKRKL